MKIETTLLKNLARNEPFVRKVIAYLKPEYFTDSVDRLVYDEINQYITKYNQVPTREALNVNLGNRDNVDEDEYAQAVELVDEIYNNTEQSDILWLEETAEKWCQERALHNAILSSIHIIDGTDKEHGKGQIPKLLQDALAISFDPAIGHDYLEDSEERFAFYHHTEEKLPFDLEMLNKITRGGLAKKSLTIIMGGVNCGKSLWLCHMAAAALSQNKNVLYITLEMAEERIAERIDANLLNVDIAQLEDLDHESYDRKVSRLKENIKGKLIIKEFPTAGAGVHHFKALLNELALKKHFKPDIIFVDYINIMCSSRMKLGNSVNSYTYIKAIAEELRGLGVECAIPIVSATQFTRSGFTNTDPGLEDTAESFGLPATADLTLAIIRTEDLDTLGQIMVKQLKNRYNDISKDRKFVVGVNFSKMRLFDVDEKAQKGLSEAHATGQEKPTLPSPRKSNVKSTKSETEENPVSSAISSMLKEARTKTVDWNI